MMKLLHVVGARPNYMKVASVMRAVAQDPRFSQVLVHTGQHYDAAMNDVFFADLGMPAPDHYLGVGSGTQAEQTARVMLAIEPVLDAERPDRVVVYGDVNATVAAALVAVKRGVPVDHVEAGLRSFDRAMPEEINRIVTDSLSSHLFIHAPEAHLEAARRREILKTLDLKPRQYAVLTLHRPSNVDDKETLTALLALL